MMAHVEYDTFSSNHNFLDVPSESHYNHGF